MNLEDDVHALMCTLLKDRRIATTFWKLGFESGLGFVFESKLARFPAKMSESIELCAALAEASSESADEVLHCLQSLSVFAESVENVPTRELVHLSGGNQVRPSIYLLPKHLREDKKKFLSQLVVRKCDAKLQY
jgi:hypothetical protein